MGAMYRWRDHFASPLAEVAQREINSLINRSFITFDGDLKSYFEILAKGKRVLHVGCYEHSTEFVNSGNWKHKGIVEVASHCLGIDIDSFGIKELELLGYNVRLVDATSDEYLGEQFDVILAGDVIEHVNNPVNLMKFCKRHLKNGGIIAVSTPNPFTISTMFATLTGRTYIPNLEHVSWISEPNAVEILSRANLNLVNIVLPYGKCRGSTFIKFIKILFNHFHNKSLIGTFVYLATSDPESVDPPISGD